MKPRRLLAGVACASTLVVVLLSASAEEPAQAHYRITAKKWYFGGFTHRSTLGTAQSRTDPISVMFWGNGTASNANVMNHLNDDWDHSVLKPWTAMDDWGCLTRLSRHLSGDQYMVFKSLGDYNEGSGQPEIAWDPYDWTMGTNRSCTNQYHMRMWDDLEHDWHTNNHSAGNWVVGNIHHDKWTNQTDGNKPKWHRLDQPWDRAPRLLVNKLDEHCSYFQWRYIYGTERFVQDKWNDGYVTLILMRHVGDPGPCPRKP